MADIARRRAEQPGDGMPLHILRHVKAQQGFFAAEPAFCQRACQLGLADARRPEEQHSSYGPPALPQAGAAASDGGCHGGHGLRLADDLGGKALFQIGKTLPLGFAHALCGHAAGLADDPCNIGGGQCPAVPAGIGNAAGRGCFVQQVNGLVGQIPPGQVTHAQLHRGVDGLGRDADTVVALIPRHQSGQNRFCGSRGGLLDHDPSKATLERGILLDGFAVFLRRGRADKLNFAACQHRL